jgi:hypothetical protein
MDKSNVEQTGKMRTRQEPRFLQPKESKGETARPTVVTSTSTAEQFQLNTRPTVVTSTDTGEQFQLIPSRFTVLRGGLVYAQLQSVPVPTTFR